MFAHPFKSWDVRIEICSKVYFSIIAGRDKNNTIDCTILIDPIVDWEKIGKV